MAMHRDQNGKIDIGSTLSQVALAIRLGKDAFWVRRQGQIVRGFGETWEASYYNGGRLAGYTLLAKLDPTILAVDSTSAPQQAKAAL